jgi:hypothetical protein
MTFAIVLLGMTVMLTTGLLITLLWVVYKTGKK